MPKPERKPTPERVPPAEPVSALAAQVSASEPSVTADATLSREVVESVPQAGLTEREQLAADIERIRKIRKPFGAYTQKLALPKRPGYHRHWFNDSPGRVEEALQAGWMHIQGKDKTPLKRVVGTARDGGPLYAYAMELPEVFWEEDVAARDERARAPLDAIKRSPFPARPGAAKPSDSGKFYSPEEEPVHLETHTVRSS